MSLSANWGWWMIIFRPLSIPLCMMCTIVYLYADVNPRGGRILAVVYNMDVVVCDIRNTSSWLYILNVPPQIVLPYSDYSARKRWTRLCDCKLVETWLFVNGTPTHKLITWLPVYRVHIRVPTWRSNTTRWKTEKALTGKMWTTLSSGRDNSVKTAYIRTRVELWSFFKVYVLETLWLTDLWSPVLISHNHDPLSKHCDYISLTSDYAYLFHATGVVDVC